MNLPGSLPLSASDALRKQYSDMLSPLKRYEEMLAPIKQYEEMWRSLKSHLRVTEEIESAIKRQQNGVFGSQFMQQQLDMQARVDGLLGDMHMAGKASKLVDSMLGLTEDKWTSNALRQFTEQNDSHKRMQEQISKLLNPVNEFQALAESLTKTAAWTNQHSVWEQLQGLSETRASFTELATAHLNALHADLQHDSFALDEETLAKANQIAETTTAQLVKQAPSVSSVAEAIAASIAAQPDRSIRILLWLTFLWVLKSVADNAIGMAMNYGKDIYLAQEAAKKDASAISRSVADFPEIAAEFRYVSAQVLVARLNPKAKSPSLGEVKFGTTVKVLKSGKDFSLISWRVPSTGEELHGWVYSRYLQKFSKY